MIYSEPFPHPTVSNTVSVLSPTEVEFSFNNDTLGITLSMLHLTLASAPIATGPGTIAISGFNNTNDYSFFEIAPGTVYTNNITGGFITAAIPEPETYAMLLAGLGLLGWQARRRKLKKASAAAAQ